MMMDDLRYPNDPDVDEMAAAPLGALSLGSLVWRQTRGWKNRFVLESAVGEVGRLEFESAFRLAAQAEVGEQAWNFDRKGVFKTNVLVWQRGEEEPFAYFHPHVWRPGGVLELPDGGEYELSSNFWGSRFEMRAAQAEQPVITFHKRGIFKITVDVKVEPQAARLPELPLLLALGMYAIQLQMHDASAAAAVAGASS